MPVIELSNVSKIYPARKSLSETFLRRAPSRPALTVLDKLDFEIEAGEIVGVLGANGAGKTTLLKILAGIVRPTKGIVRVCGVDTVAQASLASRKTAYTFSEERSFYWRLTGRQNLEFFAALDDVPHNDARGLIARLSEQLHFERYLDKPFASYSSGMKQRLVLARALLRQSRLLLLDEPSRSLDTDETAAMWRLIRDEFVQKHGITVVLVTHQLEEAATVCDRVAVLRDGRLQEECSPGQLPHSFDRLKFSASCDSQIGHLLAVPGVHDLVLDRYADRLEFEVLCEPGGVVMPNVVKVANAAGARFEGIEPRGSNEDLLTDLLAAARHD